jgi:hypothetical protein
VPNTPSRTPTTGSDTSQIQIGHSIRAVVPMGAHAEYSAVSAPEPTHTGSQYAQYDTTKGTITAATQAFCSRATSRLQTRAATKARQVAPRTPAGSDSNQSNIVGLLRRCVAQLLSPARYGDDSRAQAWRFSTRSCVKPFEGQRKAHHYFRSNYRVENLLVPHQRSRDFRPAIWPRGCYRVAAATARADSDLHSGVHLLGPTRLRHVCRPAGVGDPCHDELCVTCSRISSRATPSRAAHVTSDCTAEAALTRLNAQPTRRSVEQLLPEWEGSKGRAALAPLGPVVDVERNTLTGY